MKAAILYAYMVRGFNYLNKATYNRMKEAYLKNEIYVSRPLNIKKENRRILKELEEDIDKLLKK